MILHTFGAQVPKQKVFAKIFGCDLWSFKPREATAVVQPEV